MPRIRTIKPEFWSSPSVTQLSAVARLAYIGMWNWADDTGRGTLNLKELEGFIFPFDDVQTLSHGTSENFRDCVAEIIGSCGVVVYEVAGRDYYEIPAWSKHQRNERRAKSKFPGPEEGKIITDQWSSGTSENFRDRAAEAPQTSVLGTGEQGNRGTGSQYLVQTSGSDVPESKTTQPKAKLDTAAFDAFWDAYPRRVRKDRARKAFASACRRASAEEIIEGAKRLAADPNLPDKQFIPHPTTWLNGGGWDDEPLPDRTPSRQVPQRKTVTEQAEEVARQLGLTPEMPGQGSQIIDGDIIDQKELGA